MYVADVLTYVYQILSILKTSPFYRFTDWRGCCYLPSRLDQHGSTASMWQFVRLL